MSSVFARRCSYIRIFRSLLREKKRERVSEMQSVRGNSREAEQEGNLCAVLSLPNSVLYLRVRSSRSFQGSLRHCTAWFLSPFLHTHILRYIISLSPPLLRRCDVFLTLSLLPTSAYLVESVLREIGRCDVMRLRKINEFKRIRQKFVSNESLKISLFGFY